MSMASDMMGKINENKEIGKQENIDNETTNPNKMRYEIGRLSLGEKGYITQAICSVMSVCEEGYERM